jgi:hypothetical protein
MVDEEEHVDVDYVEEGREEEQGGRDIKRMTMKEEGNEDDDGVEELSNGTEG